jgi:hypothetical protein
LGIWILGLSTAYLLFAAWIRRGATRPKPIDGQTVFDAATFATSLMLLASVIDEQTAKAFGDSTLYLIIAGLAGAVYAIRALR